ncbi:MAG: hypothetical protein ACR2Q4_07490 [Geminicoccaceae bacterium]
MARTTLAYVRVTLAGQSTALDDIDLFRYVAAASTFVDDELADRGLGDFIRVRRQAQHFKERR